MKKLTITLCIILCVSCGVKTPFDKIRKEHRQEADLCLSLPASMVHTFIEGETRSEIKNAIQGVSRYGFMIFENNPEVGSKIFKAMKTHPLYPTYFMIKEDGTSVKILVYRKKDKINEVLLLIEDNHQSVILNLEGRKLSFGASVTESLVSTN